MTRRPHAVSSLTTSTWETMSAHVLWLALAASQSALGRLDESVKSEALRVIDEGIGLNSGQRQEPRSWPVATLRSRNYEVA